MFSLLLSNHWRKRRQCLHFVIFILLRGSCQVRYSIQEELPLGTVVGNVAKDIGLDTSVLVDRNLRIVTGTKIDREDLCGKTAKCSINLKAVIENPTEIHRITVEILDVNDNAPSFPDTDYRLEISESAVTGARFPLEGPDSREYVCRYCGGADWSN
uniref:Cadherin domain-containing protein n=1 Tax=Paramormyrops kingsleyae TaxID=1676925 RepID=A0A3B3RJH1_9TELE